MRLALDFDGVLSDTINSWIDKYNQIYTYDLKKDFITSRYVEHWNFFEGLGLTQEQGFDIFSMAWSDWKNLKPMEPHLKQKTKILHNLVDVDIVTAVQPDNLNDISQWLDWHHISYRNIVHSHAKHELDYDIYIDDASRNIQDVFNSGKIGLLMNQPWNRDMKDQIDINVDYSVGGKIQRVYNLYHAIDIVREIVKKE